MSLDNIYFFVEQPSKDGSDILLSLVHSSLGENIWKPNAGFFSKLLVVNQFYFTQTIFLCRFRFQKRTSLPPIMNA